MASASKLIMVATVVMVISLAVIIALLLVLLADLYCSLLLNRRRQHRLSTAVTSSSPLQVLFSPPQPIRSHFYAQGVLRAPRNLLFPIPAGNHGGGGGGAGTDIENQHFQLLHFLKPIDKTTEASLPIQDGGPPVSRFEDEVRDMSSSDLVYISNPIYDNDTSRGGGGGGGGAAGVAVDTPFETPETSPSNLGNISGEEERNENTPPLTPIKVPEKACSVSMKDGRFMASSGSECESNSKNDLSSSSSTGSPCTSPSW